MSKKNIKNKVVTPKVKINFPYLNEMDTAFKQNVYKVTEAWIKKEDAKDFMDKMIEVLDKGYEEYTSKGKDLEKVLPWEDKGEYIMLKNKFKSQFKPKQYTLKGKEADENITGGSDIKIACSYSVYNMMGKVGISFYIDAIQIVEINDSFKVDTKLEDLTASDYGFDVSDDDLEEDIDELPFEIEEEDEELEDF